MAQSRKKSWQEKLNIDRQPVVERSDKHFAGVKEGDMLLIPTPRLVDAYIRNIPKGHHSDLATMRKDLAAEHHAAVTCPLTSGIFLRIVAEAAYEAFEQGTPINEITPFWRIIDDKSPTAKKLSFGKAFLLERRKEESLA